MLVFSAAMNRRSRKSTSPPPSVTVEDVKGKGNAGAKVGAAKKSAGGKDAGKKPVRNEEAPKEGEQTMLDANQDKVRERSIAVDAAARGYLFKVAPRVLKTMQ